MERTKSTPSKPKTLETTPSKSKSVTWETSLLIKPRKLETSTPLTSPESLKISTPSSSKKSSPTSSNKKTSPKSPKNSTPTKKEGALISITPIQQTPDIQWLSSILEKDSVPAPTPLRATGRVADWDAFLSKGINLNFIPPVSFFKHAPLSQEWDGMAVTGIKVEVPNPFIRCAKPVYWIGTIVAFAGYKAFLQFENLGIKTKYGTWMSFCSEVPKPIGYCDQNGILLYPPNGVLKERPNFLQLARATLKDAKTICKNHHVSIVRLITKCQKYPLNTVLEVMDRDLQYRMRMATVTGIVGDRIHVSYVMESKANDPGFWFNVNSDYIHPIGWSQTVGIEFYNSILQSDFVPLPDDYFPKYPSKLKLQVGQMLEARHPILPHLICGASVAKIYKYGYFLASFHTKYEKNTPVLFWFHVTSPYIFPCGWSKDRQILLIPPVCNEQNETFDWNLYFVTKKCTPAPLHLVPERKHHNFHVGYKVEVCCCIFPSYLGPGTIRKVRDHLLYITFDGWSRTSEDYNEKTDLWIDAESGDIYPPGYAELVGHQFQGKVEEPLFTNIEERYKQLEIDREKQAKGKVAN